MLTELDFLLQMLLEHKHKKDVEQLIRDRIKEIQSRPQPAAVQPTSVEPKGNMMSTPLPSPAQAQASIPVQQLQAGANPITQEALKYRASLVRAAVTGKTGEAKSEFNRPSSPNKG